MIKKNSEKNDISVKSKNMFWILLLIPIFIYLIFGLQHLTKFETADEHYWIYSNYNNNDYWTEDNGRIHQYWDALFSGNWKKTRINDKPGITLAYVAGIGSYFKTKLDKGIFSGQIPTMNKSDKAERINLYFRLPILIFNGLFSLALFFLIKKLTENEWIALLAATMILLSPIIIGVSQIVNPDAVLWEFGFAAILSFLVFLKIDSKKYASLSAIFLGLSLLTKYSSVILIPFFFAVMLFHFLEKINFWKSDEAHKKIMRSALFYLAIVAGGLLVYAVILPDNLVEFRHFMKGSLGFKGMQWFFFMIFGLDLALIADAYFLKSRIFKTLVGNLYGMEKYFKKLVFGILFLVFSAIIINTLLANDWLRFFSVPFDASNKTIFSKFSFQRIFFMQFLPLIFSLTPVVLLGLIYGWFNEAVKPSKFQWTIFAFSLFMLVFVAASMQQEQLLIIRYSMMLYPAAILISAIVIHQALSFERKGKVFKLAAFGTIIFVGSISLWLARPFYFNYMNSLLPKNSLVTDAWGYGGYEAAQYLNQLPGAQQMRIWSDYNGTCLFFNGKCEANNLTMKNIRKKTEGLPRFEYFVSSRRGAILASGLWKNLPEEYRSIPVWTMAINGRAENSITVYKNEIYSQ